MPKDFYEVFVYQCPYCKGKHRTHSTVAVACWGLPGNKHPQAVQMEIVDPGRVRRSTPNLLLGDYRDVLFQVSADGMRIVTLR